MVEQLPEEVGKRNEARGELMRELDRRGVANAMREFSSLVHRLCYVGGELRLRVDKRRNPWTVTTECLPIPDALDHFGLSKKENE